MANDYEPLEKRILLGKECQLVTRPEDRFILIRAYDREDGRFRVDMVMPWPISAAYNLGKYSTRVEAQTEFERVDNALRRGNRTYGVRITSPTTAELVEITGTQNSI